MSFAALKMSILSEETCLLGIPPTAETSYIVTEVPNNLTALCFDEVTGHWNVGNPFTLIHLFLLSLLQWMNENLTNLCMLLATSQMAQNEHFTVQFMIDINSQWHSQRMEYSILGHP